MEKPEKIELTAEQRYKLEKLWMIYGNIGKKHTHHNHRFIQNILEVGEDTEEFYKKADKRLLKERANMTNMELTDECITEVRKILANNLFEVGDVLNLKSTSKSSSHNDGLKVVVQIESNFLYLAHLLSDCTLLRNDGNIRILAIGLKSDGLHKTKLTYNLDGEKF